MEHSLDRRALLADHWILQSLNESEFDRVLQFARVQRHDRNRRIFARGDPARNMMAVLSGRVKLSMTSVSGKEVILNIASPGDIFGEIALLDAGERTADAVTLEDTSLLVIERRDFLPILEANSKLCISLLEGVCRRLRRTTDQVEETLYLDRSARLAKAVLRLAKDHGKDAPDGIRIAVKLSQRELGNLVGLTRESMNKQLSEWRKDGILSHTDGVITIHDQTALARFCDDA